MDYVAALEELMTDRKLFKESLFEVENKERMLVPYQLNTIQARMEVESGSRDIYCKPGQIGATTWCVADFLEDNVTIDGTVSVIISYDEWVAQRQLIKAKRFYSALKRRVPTVPKLDHDAAHHLSFTDDSTGFNSDFYIYSARSYALGRGEAIHNLLLDEYAFWPEGTHETTFASAVQRVPLTINTRIRVVSTANGEDNPFHEMYTAAKEGKETRRSVYTAHYYPWFIHEEYVMYEDNIFCLPGDAVFPLPNIQPDEAALLLQFEHLGFDEYLSHAKLRWRRYKIVEMMSLRRTGETTFIFSQEYPEDDETCFLLAGDMAYDGELISQKIRGCFPAPVHKTVVDSKTGTSAGVDVWHDPEEGLGYILSIDPGKGKTSESVGQVWTFQEGFVDKDEKVVPAVMKHCATICGWYDEAVMGAYCKELGYYYVNTVLCPEDNLDLVSHVKDFPNLYYREDPRDGKLYKSIGWYTSPATKPYMVTEVNRHLEELDCHDIRFWSQLRNVRRDPGIRGGLRVIGPEDHHMAGAIAIVCRNAMPVARGYAGSSGEDGGWGEDWGN